MGGHDSDVTTLDAVPFTRMPDPVAWTAEARYRVYLGNVLIAYGWITVDGEIWRHRNEPREMFTDCAAIARELGKWRSGLRRQTR